MSTNEEPSLPKRPGPVGDGAGTPTGSLEWVDIEQQSWRIELAPERIVLRSGDDTLDLPAGSWVNDIYVAQHGQGYIIRIETFERAVRFLVSEGKARPFLAHLEAAVPARPAPAKPVQTVAPSQPLLFPKVSPLAVWALISSALVFIPVLGLVPAVATVVLVVLHYRIVRRAPAWRHSRALCRVAVVLLVAGLGVSALATLGLSQRGDIYAVERLVTSGGPSERNWGVIVGAILVVLFSLSVHEAGHAIAAWWLGDGLARSRGRVTLNPLAHIDLFGTIMLPLILAMAGAPVFGYAKPVPVNVGSLRRYRRAHILISIAGPGSNLLLAMVSLMLLITLGCVLRLTVPHAAVANFSTLDFAAPVSASGFVLAPVLGPLCTILKLSFIINTVLAVFNLIPIPPLDGSWVLEHLFPLSLGRVYERIRPFGFLIFLVAIWSDLFFYLMYPIGLVLFPSFLLLAGATGY